MTYFTTPAQIGICFKKESAHDRYPHVPKSCIGIEKRPDVKCRGEGFSKGKVGKDKYCVE